MDEFPDLDGGGSIRQPLNATEEKWHREMQRRSNDVIRVKNPTNQDYYVDWDHFVHRIPANGTADLPRYVATKYCRDMKTQMINEENDAKLKQHLADKRSKGEADYKSLYERDQETVMTPSYPRTDDYKKSVAIYDDLWVGVVHEFGLDQLYTKQDSRSGEVDQTPQEVKILQNLDKKRITDTQVYPETPPQTIVEPFEPNKSVKSTKKELEKEITSND